MAKKIKKNKKKTTAKEFEKKSEDILRNVSQGVAKVPIIGGISRLARYPAEFGRMVSGLGEYGIQKALGADEQKLQGIINEYTTPLFTTQEEFNKMSGETSAVSPVLEGMSAGSEASWLMPFGPMGNAIKSAVGTKMAGKAGSKLVPWLAGKVGEGAIRGPFTGLASSDVSKPETILPNMAKSAGTQAALNVVFGGIGEGLKGLKNIGTRTSARAQGIPGKTTAEMAENATKAKQLGIGGITAQNRLDKAFPKVVEVSEKKAEELGKMDVGKLQDMKNKISLSIDDAVNNSVRKGEILSSGEYQSVREKVLNAKSFTELDNAASQWDDLINYDREKLGSVAEELYKKARDGVVKTLKEEFPKYASLKGQLSDIYSTTINKATLKAAERGVQGLTFPLIVGGAESPIPKELFSALGSAVGGLEKGIGKIAGSPLVQGGLSQLAARQPQAQQQSIPEQQIEQTGLGTQQVSPESQAPSMDISTFDPIAIALQEQGFNVGQQAQPTRQVDWDRLISDLTSAVANGQLTSADASFILDTFRSQYGSQQGSDITEQPQTIQQAYDLVSQQYPEMSETTRLSMAKQIMSSSSGGSAKDINNAQSGLTDLATLEQAMNTTSLLPQVLGQGNLSAAVGGEDYQIYQGAAKNIADIIARIRTGAQINEEEMKLYMREFLPAWFESPEAKQAKIERVRNYLEGILSGQISPSDIPAPKGSWTPAQSTTSGNITDQYIDY